MNHAKHMHKRKAWLAVYKPNSRMPIKTRRAQIAPKCNPSPFRTPSPSRIEVLKIILLGVGFVDYKPYFSLVHGSVICLY